MANLLWSGVIMVLLSGCGWNGTPTRNNDITPLTSIEIVAIAPTIAAHTSTRLSVTGNYSGLFTRDITNKVVWSSDTPDVAGFVTPALPSRVTGHVPGSAILTAAMGNISATFELTISPATVTALSITPAAPSLARGSTSQLAANGAFSDGTKQDLTFDANWLSSAPDVATVSDDSGSKGLVRAIAAGTATITATFDSAVAPTLLTVTTPVLQSIAVSPANPAILSLSKVPFKASGTYSDGSTADISSQVAWSSSNTGFATIDTAGAVKTLVPGTTSITAKLAGVSGTSNVKVTGGVLTGITITPVNPKLVKGITVQLTATGAFGSVISRDITGAVDWSVEVATVANVTTPGGNQAWLNPLALSSGTIVKATSGLVPPATTTLTVVAPQVVSLDIAPASLTDLTVGTSNLFTLTATYNDDTKQDVTASSDWSSSAATTASVDNTDLVNKGRVTGVATGTTNISATFEGGIPKPAEVTVKARTLSDLTITPVTSASPVGKQITFTATASYTDGFKKDVTANTDWSIDNTNVAILADPRNQPGQVVMVDGGTAILTARFGNMTKTVPLTPLAP
jgi:uncharacterized protein YjdB